MDRARVLVVDDDEDVLDMVRLGIAKAGIRTDGATTAEEGLAKMEMNMYPVVVLDIHMPGMSGVEMLSALKQRNSLVQVIMLTADASMERVIECMDRGAIDFLSKTADSHEIIRAVSEALGRAARWMSWLGNSRSRSRPQEATTPCA